MSYTVTVTSVDTGYPLPHSGLYTLGASVVLTDAQYAAIDPTYRASHFTVTASNPGTTVYNGAADNSRPTWLAGFDQAADINGVELTSGVMVPLTLTYSNPSWPVKTPDADDYFAMDNSPGTSGGATRFLIKQKGVYVFTVLQCLISVGSVTDGTVALYPFLNDDLPYGSSTHLSTAKLPLIAGSAFVYLPFQETRYVTASSYYYMNCRAQYSGTPTTKPKVGSLQIRIQKVA